MITVYTTRNNFALTVSYSFCCIVNMYNFFIMILFQKIHWSYQLSTLGFFKVGWLHIFQIHDVQYLIKNVSVHVVMYVYVLVIYCVTSCICLWCCSSGCMEWCLENDAQTQILYLSMTSSFLLFCLNYIHNLCYKCKIY